MLYAESFYDGLERAEGADHPSVKEKEELEACVRDLQDSARIRSGLSQLLAERLHWVCEADYAVCTALSEQVETLAAERELLKAELTAAKAENGGGEGAAAAAGEEWRLQWRLQDVERTLRETRAELDACKIRCGDLTGWKDPMHGRTFSVQTLLKAGKSAL